MKQGRVGRENGRLNWRTMLISKTPIQRDAYDKLIVQIDLIDRNRIGRTDGKVHVIFQAAQESYHVADRCFIE